VVPRRHKGALVSSSPITEDTFVYVSAVRETGLPGLNEGQKISYDVEHGQAGKTSAVNLRASWPQVSAATPACILPAQPARRTSLLDAPAVAV
jgi:cold shock CspA family protein